MLYSEELPWPSELKPFQANDASVLRNPYPHYAWMRKNAPVLKTRSEAGDLYFLSRYADVKQAFRDNKRFSSATMDPKVLPFVIAHDPPDHTRLRLILAKAFTPKAIGNMEGFARGLARRLMDDYIAGDERRYAAKFVTPMTIGTIGEMLGISVDRIDLLYDWSKDVANFFGRVGRGTPKAPGDEEGFLNMLAYLKESLAKAAERSDETIAGNLARMSADGSVSEFEALANAAFLLLAGHETTTILLMNLAMLLAQRPEFLARLKTDPQSTKLFTDEMLRFRPSVHRNARKTTEDIVIGDDVIPAGSSARLLVGSANRDETQFPNPDVFDLDRDTTGHLGFGTGVHMCLGAFLARLEARVVMETLAERVTELNLDPAVETEFYSGGPMGSSGPVEAGIALR